MTTLQTIYFIATHPEFTNVGIDGTGNRTPLQAIEYLSSDPLDNVWQINTSLEKNTLLIWFVGYRN